jgi:sortase A
MSVEKAVGRAVLASQRIAGEILERGNGSRRQVRGSEASLARFQTAPAAPPQPAATAGATLVSPPPIHLVSDTTIAPGVPVPPTVAPPVEIPPLGTKEPSAEASSSPSAADVASRRDQRLRTAFVAFGWVRNVGLILLLFAAWQLWGTSIEHDHAQQALGHQFQSQVQESRPHPVQAPLVSADTRLPPPAEGSVVARLQIPAIGVDQYVVEGTTEADLAKGPGHYVGTSQPGQAGNVAIAGHRTTYGAPFNRLDHVAVNDRIILTSTTGRALTYIVSQAPVAVSPRDVAILNTGSDSRLTLTTCNPKFSASQRLVVVGLLSSPRAAVPTAVRPNIVHVVADSTGWNVGYLPLALLILALLVLLGLANERASVVYGRVGRWLVLSPIWAAGLYFLFVALTKLLPANL